MLRQLSTNATRLVATNNVRYFSSKVDTSALDELLGGGAFTKKSLIPEHSNAASTEAADSAQDKPRMRRIKYNADVDYSDAIDGYENKLLMDEFGRSISNDRTEGFELVHYPSPRFIGREHFVHHQTCLRFSLNRDALGRNIEDLSEIADGIEEVGRRTNLAKEIHIKREEKMYDRHEKPTVFRQRMMRRAKRNRDKGYLIDVLREAIYEPRLFKGDVHWGFYDPLGTPGQTYYNWDDKFN